MMTKYEYKLLPCILCTVAYNSYVAGQKLVTKINQAKVNFTLKKTQEISKNELPLKKLNSEQ